MYHLKCELMLKDKNVEFVAVDEIQMLLTEKEVIFLLIDC